MFDRLKVLFLSNGDIPRSMPLLDFLSSHGVSVCVESVGLFGKKVPRYFPSREQLAGLRQKIVDHDPDVMVFQDERDRAGLLAILSANGETRKPVIWFRGAIDGFNAFSPIDHYILRHKNLARLVVRSYAMINNWAGSLTMSSLVRNNRIECCHHFIQLNPLEKKLIDAKRRDWGITPDDLVIGSIATVRPIKNIELAVRAASAVRSKSPIRFLIIGPHSKAFRERLETIMPGSIIAPGAIPDAGRFAALFDIFVSPTKCPGEGFGLALAEAMACAAPVVASHAGGAGDIVEHGKTGILLPENDVSWTRALQALVDDPSLRLRMGQAGQMRIAERFSIEAIASDFMRILEDVLAETRG